MTEYWVSNPRQWCRDCKVFIDCKKSSIKKHEASSKHRERAEKRRNMLWNLTQEKKEFQKQMQNLEAVATRSFEKDTAYFSQFKNKHKVVSQGRNFNPLMSFHSNKFSEEPQVIAAPPVNIVPNVSKEFALPPGMKSAIEAVWLYKDDCDKVQGPCKLSEMIDRYRRKIFGTTTLVKNVTKSDAENSGWKLVTQYHEIVGDMYEKIENTLDEGNRDETKNTENKKMESNTNGIEKKRTSENLESAVCESTGMGSWTPVPSSIEQIMITADKAMPLRKIPKKSSRLNSFSNTIKDDIESTGEAKLCEDNDTLSSSVEKDHRLEQRKEREAIEISLNKGELYATDEANKKCVTMKKRRRPRLAQAMKKLRD